jgi:prolyl-tRNA synthetase
MKGACLRVELGPRDLDAGQCVVARRDTAEKAPVPLDQMVETVGGHLGAMQSGLLERAREFREANTRRVDTWDEFEAAFEGEGGGGFVLAHWDGTGATEGLINERTRATIRCVPLEPLGPGDDSPGKCVLTGNASERRVLFARAY